MKLEKFLQKEGTLASALMDAIGQSEVSGFSFVSVPSVHADSSDKLSDGVLKVLSTLNQDENAMYKAFNGKEDDNFLLYIIDEAIGEENVIVFIHESNQESEDALIDEVRSSDEYPFSQASTDDEGVSSTEDQEGEEVHSDDAPTDGESDDADSTADTSPADEPSDNVSSAVDSQDEVEAELSVEEPVDLVPNEQVAPVDVRILYGIKPIGFKDDATFDGLADRLIRSLDDALPGMADKSDLMERIRAIAVSAPEAYTGKTLVSLYLDAPESTVLIVDGSTVISMNGKIELTDVDSPDTRVMLRIEYDNGFGVSGYMVNKRGGDEIDETKYILEEEMPNPLVTTRIGALFSRLNSVS